MLTPMDIDRKEFKKVLHGYQPEEVEDFLAEINHSYEKLYLEHQEAKEQIERLSDAVSQYKSMEETLQNALVVAKQDGEKMKVAAQQQADILLQNAKKQAEEELSRLSYQYEQMKRDVEVYRGKVISLLHAQLDIIKEYGEEPCEVEPDPATMLRPEEFLSEKDIPLEDQNTAELPTIPLDDITNE